jgi:hypothetical protein
MGAIAGFGRRTRRLGAAKVEAATRQITQTDAIANTRFVFICKFLIFSDCIAGPDNHKKPFVYTARQCSTAVESQTPNQEFT